jgi:hypothetical protein
MVRVYWTNVLIDTKVSVANLHGSAQYRFLFAKFTRLNVFSPTRTQTSIPWVHYQTTQSAT